MEVLIDGNMLKLLEDEKRYYDKYFGQNDIIEHFLLYNLLFIF